MSEERACNRWWHRVLRFWGWKSFSIENFSTFDLEHYPSLGIMITRYILGYYFLITCLLLGTRRKKKVERPETRVRILLRLRFSDFSPGTKNSPEAVTIWTRSSWLNSWVQLKTLDSESWPFLSNLLKPFYFCIQKKVGKVMHSQLWSLMVKCR